MPGVLIIEAMAQAGAVLILRDVEERREPARLLPGIDEARFRRPSSPVTS